MGQMIQDTGWRIPDDLWEQMVVLLPADRAMTKAPLGGGENRPHAHHHGSLPQQLGVV